MGRVWTLAGALVLGCVLIYLTVGFVGVVSLKFASAILGAGAVAAYLPGGNSVSRGLFMLLGVVFGSLSFLLGAAAFPDTNVGLLLGALVPILLSAVAATFTRSPETLLVMLLGAGSMGAVYTTDFFSDPQSINYTLPIALGQVMILISFGYLLGVLAKELGPKAPAPAAAEDAEPQAPDGWAPGPADSTSQSEVVPATASADTASTASVSGEGMAQ